MKKIVPALFFLLALLLPACRVSAAFTDVDGETASAVFRLSTLGIIDGYPDGTFRPGNGITRAEFAKIAVMALGLEKALDFYADAPVFFSDVKAGDWYYKYVAAAVEHGILKGYPVGAFKPNVPILETEAITILLRLLGYNDNLPGGWPHNYVLKAAELGLVETKDFTKPALATRAFVAVLLAKALDANLVNWNDFSQTFFPTGKTLLAGNLKGEILPAVKVFSTRAGADQYSMIVTDADNHATSLTVANDAAILGDISFKELQNHYVDCILQDGVVKGIAVLSTAVSGEVEDVNIFTRRVKINGKELEFSSNIGLPQRGAKITVYIYNNKVYAVQK